MLHLPPESTEHSGAGRLLPPQLSGFLVRTAACPVRDGLAGLRRHGGALVSTPASEHICSAKGCRARAEWALRWNNPKIHTPDRRKTWLACTEHREHLGGFLSARGFLRETEPFDPSA